MNPAIAFWCDDTEQLGHDIDAAECAAHARILDGGNGVRACSWIVDRNLLAAEWVGVWVARVCQAQYVGGEGDEGVAIIGGIPAGPW